MNNGFSGSKCLAPVEQRPQRHGIPLLHNYCNIKSERNVLAKVLAMSQPAAISMARGESSRLSVFISYEQTAIRAIRSAPIPRREPDQRPTGDRGIPSQRKQSADLVGMSQHRS